MQNKVVNTKRIKVYGVGGQGIKLMVDLIGAYCAKALGKYVALTTDYDTVVRKGKIEGDLIISDAPINSPLINTADMAIFLDIPKNAIKAEKSYFDISLKDNAKLIEIEKQLIKSGIQFFDFSNGGVLPKNMVGLGIAIKYILDFEDFSEIEISTILGTKASEENIEGVKFGLDLFKK